ncbi:unnamed protein product [Rotaria magnacalcarata]|nr:unnamed protein product [Rotaria magnacalcarata]
MAEPNPRKLPRISESSTITSDLNDISPLHPKTIIKSQQLGDGDEKSLTIRSQPDTIQLHHSNTSTIKGLSNPCYFSLVNDTIDTYDIEKQTNNRVVISIRGLQNNNNNNEEEREITKF